MNKQEIQQRVLLNGKPLDLDKFTWDEETKTFSSNVDGLVMDFKGIDYCTIKCGNYCKIDCDSDCTINCGGGCTIDCDSGCTIDCDSGCTIKCGYYCKIDCDSYCTIKCDSDCTIKCGNYCTIDCGWNCMIDCNSDCTISCGWRCMIKCGWNCTIKCGNYCKIDCGGGCTIDCNSNCTIKSIGDNSVIIRRDMFELIQVEKDIEYKICPWGVKGYLADNIYSETKTECIIIDSILSEIVSKKDKVYKVRNYDENKKCFSDKITYIVKDIDIYSHGDTIKEAKESLIYKISNRDTSVYKDLTLDSVLSKAEAIKCYRIITGSCESQTRAFVENLKDIKDSYTIKEVIDLTKRYYGNDVFSKFFDK